MNALRQWWATLRRISGDDAYERYLGHWRAQHAGAAPLDRAAFFRAEQAPKWAGGPRRCC